MEATNMGVGEQRSRKKDSLEMSKWKRSREKRKKECPKIYPLGKFLNTSTPNDYVLRITFFFFFLKVRNKCLVCTIFTMKASSPRTFQTFGIMGNRQPRTRPSDVSRFSCICNTLALANLTGVQSIWRDLIQPHENDHPKSPHSRESHGQAQPGEG